MRHRSASLNRLATKFGAALRGLRPFGARSMWPPVSERDLHGKSFFITGANAGIGRATALALGRRGATLFLAGRSLARTQPVLDELRDGGNSNVHFLPVSLEDLRSVRECAQSFLAREERLDVLINNAGIAGRRGVTKDGFEVMFGVNHLAHFLLTELLLPRLAESARDEPGAGRIVNVSSLAHYRTKRLDWEALCAPTRHFTGQPEYAVSKLCNVLHAAELARRITGQNIRTYALHPGVIATEIWRAVPWPIRPVIKRFMGTLEEGAATPLYCATSPAVAGESGLYYDRCRAVPPSPLAQDPELARELFQRSLRWTGLA